MIYLEIQLSKIPVHKIEPLRQYLNKNGILPYTEIKGDEW
jgi:hypothetical protein